MLTLDHSKQPCQRVLSSLLVNLVSKNIAQSRIHLSFVSVHHPYQKWIDINEKYLVIWNVIEVEPTLEEEQPFQTGWLYFQIF